MKKIALASIRAQNLKQIFDVIVKEGPTTRGRLAQATNLSLMTVSNVVENMINCLLYTSPLILGQGAQPAVCSR